MKRRRAEPPPPQRRAASPLHRASPKKTPVKRRGPSASPAAKRRRSSRGVSPTQSPERRKSGAGARGRTPQRLPSRSPQRRRSVTPKSARRSTGGGDDLTKMSVKALKALLAEKRIPCTDCVEKADLIQRLREKTKLGGRSPAVKKLPLFVPAPRAKSPKPKSPPKSQSPPKAASPKRMQRLDAAQEIERLSRRGMSATTN